MKVSSAVIDFNDRNCGTVKFYIGTNMDTGYFTKCFIVIEKRWVLHTKKGQKYNNIQAMNTC